MLKLRGVDRRSIIVVILLALSLTACAIIPVPTRSARVGSGGQLGECADFFSTLDQQVRQAHVVDPGAFRVQGYPYLRVNRFLVSFREEADHKATFAAWVDRMQELDQDARKYEIANLPKTTESASDSTTDLDELEGEVTTCGNLLRAADLADSKGQQKLRKTVAAPDEYMSLWRVLGLYPFTSLFVSHGVSSWHAAEHKSFSTEAPVGWQSIRYVPEKSSDLPSARQVVEQTKRDALGIPKYSIDDREVLFRIYAPIWEVQTIADSDRIGTPVWTSQGELDIDTRQPVTYTLLSYTRFGKEILTQLNYIIWFPARPKQSALDLYGGVLDGLNFRVTLDRDGEPLLCESIHNCGCYYKAYPTRRLRVREKIDYAEPPLILKAPDLTLPGELMTVAMESRTHYVRHLYPSARPPQPETVVYSLAGYGRLRSLPDSNGRHRSMFSQDSLASGSERLERFILWPTGVVSPGAMRQWGRHAVAFVGERHFDDPFALEKMFIAVSEPPAVDDQR